MVRHKHKTPRIIKPILIVALSLGLIASACTAPRPQPSESMEEPLESQTILASHSAPGTQRPSHTQAPVDLPPDHEIADYIGYDAATRSFYIAGLRLFEEFSTPEFGFANEGSASLDPDKKILGFRIRLATGSVTGALDGPLVAFTMDLAGQSIIDKTFEPAPDYKSLGLDEFEHYSLMVIELDEARMVEIGQLIASLLEKRVGED